MSVVVRGGSGKVLEWSDAGGGGHLEGKFFEEFVDLLDG